MESLIHFNLIPFIKGAGYLGLFAIIFSESGLFVGFFLPGDSLLFTAGFLASQGFLNIWVLMGVTFIGAVLGDSVGYAFGKRIGPAIFSREDSLLFNRKNIERSRAFYERYGTKAIILARFMPVVRTFAPILAGVGQMRYRTFLIFNVIGAFLWTIGLSALGYYLGSAIPDIDRYLLPIIALIIFFSVLPTIIHVARDKDSREKIRIFFKRS